MHRYHDLTLTPLSPPAHIEMACNLETNPRKFIRQYEFPTVSRCAFCELKYHKLNEIVWFIRKRRVGGAHLLHFSGSLIGFDFHEIRFDMNDLGGYRGAGS